MPALLAPAALLWALVLAAVAVPEAAVWMAVVTGGTAAACPLILRRRGGALPILVVLVLASCGAAHVAVLFPARESVATQMTGAATVSVQGVIVSKAESTAAGGHGVDVRADDILADGTAAIGADSPGRDADRAPWRPGSVPVRLILPPDLDAPPLGPGVRVTAEGQAVPARAADRSVAVVFVREIAVATPAQGAAALAMDLRRGFVALAAALPGPGAGLLPGLAIGDTSAVDDDLRTAMQDSSLTHLTAVSGANCALVVALTFGALSLLRAPRWARILVSLATLGGFVILVTPEPSVVRAATMAAIALLALVLNRPVAGLGVLACAVAGSLLADPWLASSLGFALSASATAGLLVLARPLAAGLARFMPRPLSAALAVPLAAQLACGPLLILIDPQVPVYGVVANLLAAPAAPLATIVGLAACIVQPIAPVAQVLTAIAWVPSAWIAATAQVVSSWPGARLPWLSGLGGALALALVSAAIVLALMRPGRWGRMRLLGLVVTAAVAGSGIGGILLARPLAPLTTPDEWSVAQCDVGQGDALVLRDAGRIATIDTGPDADLFGRCLDRLGVTRIDVAFLTHFDHDHVGGSSVLAGRTGTIVHGPPGEPADRALLSGLAEAGARLMPASEGATGSLGNAQWRVLWPPRSTSGVEPGNDASLVVDVRASTVASEMPTGLYLGDLSASAQRLALRDLHTVSYDVVKVAHHGSADQDAAVYDRVGAAVAMIGVGENDYGHPRAEALDLLHAAGSAVVRSDLHGLVVLRREDDAVHVWRERGPATGGSDVGGDG
ncbi:ComEC/Rec2 family competence protein [Microbacterium sp. LRZ72]|uniref:ComEC/Rec2 family competence protein n=1 Tax=Microbacterium sp. LRZ72 TaxID=2942481 RepID=UPI0029A1D79D|nr:ComEC/Rec2 family competence protein [Microbacterium sp. LRZ72]MDX2375472.1 ComEC/Rec2 family competence protein [Microbacterium sp. LRZ72]